MKWLLRSATLVGVLLGSVVLQACGDDSLTDRDRSLTGTRWVVLSVTSANQRVTNFSTTSTRAYIVIDGSGRLSGFTGCAPLDGRAVVVEKQITFTITNPPACTANDLVLHNIIIATLTGSVSWDIDWQSLTLTRPDGTTLRLQAFD